MKKIIKKFIPSFIINIRRNILQKRRRKKENDIKNHFLNLDKKLLSRDVLNIVNFIEKNGLSPFPYEWTKKYNAAVIKVFFDEKQGMSYVLHKNKKLFFPKSWTHTQIAQGYNGLLLEQDTDSPHRYEAEKYTVRQGDIIADIGAAEGIWALENIEVAKTAYLFECEKIWIEALEKTFQPWKEKTIIANNYVSNITKSNKIKLDDFFKNKPVNFIKADIEGAEKSMLLGASETLKNNKRLKLLLCAYHNRNDASDLNAILKKAGFETEFSKGYMIFEDTVLRRGILRASNCKD